MLVDKALLIVTAGGQRYAVVQSSVRALNRVDEPSNMVALAELLGGTVAADEQYALIVANGTSATALRVQQADLHEPLPQIALPDWLAQQTHPAICGLILDGTDLLPLVDLMRLAPQTGYEDQ